MVAANCEEEQTDELEAVVQGGVEAVLFVALIGADAVEGFDLVDQVVVEQQDILRLDICAAILLEQAERVAEIENALEDGLFLRVERKAIERRVGHDIGCVEVMCCDLLGGAVSKMRWASR